jgi:hypothetical protein
MTALPSIACGRTLLLALALAFCLGPAHTAGPDPGDTNGFDVSNASVPLPEIQRGGPPKDGIPAIDEPKFVDAAKSGLKGMTVHIRFDAGSRSAEAFDAQRRALPATMAYGFAWVAFHPRTEVLRAP